MKLTYDQLIALTGHLAARLREQGCTAGPVYGVPRGGVNAALLLHSLNPHWPPVDTAEEAVIIVDDLIDSGQTLSRFGARFPNKILAALVCKDLHRANSLGVLWGGQATATNDWVVFPWDDSEVTSGEDICVRLLQYIGEDPTREGLLETPSRFLNAWRFWTSGYRQNPKDVLKTFEDGAAGYDEMIVVNKIPVHSFCEHHMAAIFGLAHVAYIPNGRVVGLSKIPRLVEVFARRLQVQERLTVQIADALFEHLHPKGVGVILECRHLCMESRGVQAHGSVTSTSALRGVMQEGKVREEFMALKKGEV